MRFAALALTALTLVAAPAFAADMPKPTLSLEGVPGGRYDIDPGHTNVVFSLNHLGFSNYIGRFNKIDGTLFFDSKDPTSSGVKISIDIASIDTNNDVLEEKLTSKDWFNAKEFPTASFTSTKVEKLSDNKAKITGDLSLHGVTRPVVLDVTFNGTAVNPYAKAQAMGFSATTTIKRSDFGISAYVPAVGDEVKLIIETEFTQNKG